MRCFELKKRVKTFQKGVDIPLNTWYYNLVKRKGHKPIRKEKNMKKIINGKKYDTETAEFVGSYSYSKFSSE